MRILKLIAKNFRTLEDVEIKFNNYYTAISGKNNSGKSNVIRAISAIFSNYDLPFIFELEGLRIFRDISAKKDLTNWKAKDKPELIISATFEINSKFDSGIYKFLEEFILKSENIIDDQSVELTIQISNKSEEGKKNEVSITYKGIEITDSYQRDEILRKIRSLPCSLFHNSTKYGNISFTGASKYDTINEFLSEEDKEVITKKKDDLVSHIKNRLKKQQKEFSSFLGRLEEKYEVGLSISEPSLTQNSINISLKEKGGDIDLDDWGSGTRNRTIIFLKLLNAKRVKESESNSDKITPFVIIEEPESFLHPSAQAEFGRVLQDIAEELKIQVIVTTHSVYLLNHKQAESNILLDRPVESGNKLKGSFLVDTSGEKWYEPFALTLGINGDDFGPLKTTIFSQKDEIILVEGETDKKYLELLKDDQHGDNKLTFKGDIFPYGGADNLKNNVLLRFIKGRFTKFLITVDLDKFNDVKKALETVGLTENIEYLKIGKQDPGKQNIEGLLPSKTLSKVYAENSDLVLTATSNIPEKKEAQSKLKQKLYIEFEQSKEFTDEYFGEFYKLTKKINKVFK